MRALHLFLLDNAKTGESKLKEPMTNLAQVWIHGIVEELHGELVAPQKNRVRIMPLGVQACAEVIQRCL
jgi:hypothetical protein